MAQYAYKYAVGFDQSSLTNVESTIPYAPTSKPTPLGSVKRRTLNQHSQWNGTREIKWFWGALSNANFETLINALFGNFTTESRELTIDSRGRDYSMHRYNVVAETPVEGQDYTIRQHGDVEGLTITFRVIAEIAIP